MTRRPPTRAAPGLAAVLTALCALPAAAEPQAVAYPPEAGALEWGGCPGFMPEGCRIAVLHGDPAAPNADIFFRVPGGAEVPRHRHTSPERMVLVSGEMRVTYDGQDPVTLRPGTYARGPAEKPHRAACLSSEPCTLFIAFVDPIDAEAVPRH
jgi:quercetin dioxygenase-like cupin family protein